MPIDSRSSARSKMIETRKSTRRLRLKCALTLSFPTPSFATASAALILRRARNHVMHWSMYNSFLRLATLLFFMKMRASRRKQEIQIGHSRDKAPLSARRVSIGVELVACCDTTLTATASVQIKLNLKCEYDDCN